MNDIVELAQKIATAAHKGQFRRDNKTPYIVHPRAVASRVSDDPTAQAVAWLHDTIEDTEETELSLIESGIPKPIVDSVVRLTKREAIGYEDYLHGIASDPVAVKVKIADMLTNLSDAPTEKQIIKYAKGLLILLDKQD